MTREEEIIKQGILYISKICPACLNGDDPFNEEVRDLNRNGVFEAGAKWADEHPKKSCWINVEDKLPCDFPEIIHFGFTNRVFVKSHDDKYGVSFMIKKKDRWEWEGKIPKYWMFIPK